MQFRSSLPAILVRKRAWHGACLYAVCVSVTHARLQLTLVLGRRSRSLEVLGYMLRNQNPSNCYFSTESDFTAPLLAPSKRTNQSPYFSCRVHPRCHSKDLGVCRLVAIVAEQLKQRNAGLTTRFVGRQLSPLLSSQERIALVLGIQQPTSRIQRA